MQDGGTGLVWSPNYSVGVNVFLQLASEASRRIARYKEYGAWAWEIHHSAKKDAPSGTLLKVVNEMKAEPIRAAKFPSAPIVPAPIPAPMRSASIPRPTRSPSVTQPAAAKASPAGR